MDIKKYLKAMPVLAALLLTASCSSEDNEIVEAPQPAQTRIIPFTATVNSGAQTRATLDDSNNYMFQTDDKLYVWGGNSSGDLYGELSWVKGDTYDYFGESKEHTYSGTFSGNLTWTGEGDIPNLELYAVVKSEKDEILGTLEDFKNRNYRPNYALATSFASTLAEAVEKFSFLQATATYLSPDFNFYDSQNSAFLSFDITLEDGTAAGEDISVKISNNGNVERTGTVTTVEESGKVKAKFVAGFLGGSINVGGVDTYYTTLNNATVTLGTRDAISFGGAEPKNLDANKIYRVTRPYTRYQVTYSVDEDGRDPLSYSPLEMGSSSQLQDFLSLWGLNTNVTNCEKTGDGSSINLTDLGGTPKDYKFEVAGEGTTKFIVTSGDDSYHITITVAKMSSLPTYTVTATAMGQSKPVTGKSIGYKTRLHAMLEALGASSYISLVSGCTRYSPTSDWSVNYVNIGGTPTDDYEFTVIGEGTTVFNLTVMGQAIPVSIEVTKE